MNKIVVGDLLTIEGKKYITVKNYKNMIAKKKKRFIY